MIFMDLVIYMEALNSIVIRDEDKDVTSNSLDNSIAWIDDPLGFVHPDGPFFEN